MCRYALSGPYRDHYACFACRKSFKWPHDRNADVSSLPAPICPQCRGPVEAMGLDFKAPPSDNVKQWQKVRILADHGLRYASCGCSGPDPRPEQLRDVEAFLAGRLPESEGERLLRRLDDASRAHAARGRREPR
jgi:hypothetical protein